MFHIEEIDPDEEGIRRFQIVANEDFFEEVEPYVDPMDEVDEAICSLYEMILEMQNG